MPTSPGRSVQQGEHRLVEAGAPVRLRTGRGTGYCSDLRRNLTSSSLCNGARRTPFNLCYKGAVTGMTHSQARGENEATGKRKCSEAELRPATGGAALPLVLCCAHLESQTRLPGLPGQPPVTWKGPCPRGACAGLGPVRRPGSLLMKSAGSPSDLLITVYFQHFCQLY